MIGEHVRVETHAERHGPERVAESLDDDHERRDVDDWAHEVLEIGLEPQGLDAVRVVRAERYEAEGEGDVEGRRRRSESWNEPEDVRYGDEYEERREQRDVVLGVVGNRALGNP